MYNVCYNLAEMPTETVLSLEEVKLYLKIEHNDEDELLLKTINSVMRIAETYTGICILDNKINLKIRGEIPKSFDLHHKPAHTMLYVVHKNEDETLTMLSEKDYQFDSNDSKLIFSEPRKWKNLIIQYMAGLGKNHEEIPADLKQTMLNHLAYFYEHRGVIRALPETIMQAYKPYKIVRMR